MAAHDPLDVADDILLGHAHDDGWVCPIAGLDRGAYETEGTTEVTAEGAEDIGGGVSRTNGANYSKTGAVRSTARVAAIDVHEKAPPAPDELMSLTEVPDDPPVDEAPGADPNVIAVADDVHEPMPKPEPLETEVLVAPVSPPRPARRPACQQPVVCVLPPEKLHKLAEKCCKKMLAGRKVKDSDLRSAVLDAGGYMDGDPVAGNGVDDLHRAALVALSAVKISGGDLDLATLPAVIIIDVPAKNGARARAWTRAVDPSGCAHLKIHNDPAKAFSRLEAMLLFGGYAFFRCRYAARKDSDREGRTHDFVVPVARIDSGGAPYQHCSPEAVFPVTLTAVRELAEKCPDDSCDLLLQHLQRGTVSVSDGVHSSKGESEVHITLWIKSIGCHLYVTEESAPPTTMDPDEIAPVDAVELAPGRFFTAVRFTTADSNRLHALLADGEAAPLPPAGWLTQSTRVVPAVNDVAVSRRTDTPPAVKDADADGDGDGDGIDVNTDSNTDAASTLVGSHAAYRNSSHQHQHFMRRHPQPRWGYTL